MIKEKIKNGEGMLKLKNLTTQEEFWMAASVYGNNTDRQNPTWKEWQKNYSITYTPIESDYKIENNNLVLKTDEEKQQENIMGQASKILNKLQPLMIAMNFQENAKSKGSNSANAIFTDNQIKDFGNYISEIAKGNLNIVMPELPEGYKNLL